ncbi:MAG: two-component sensor histidine kinase, partial [Spirochaetia bacterium]|nr:two-component sensor histidine kinase [Spirochaetia bacterium]
ERELLETISDHFASLVERFRLIEESNRAKVAEASEKLYRTLFDSISHELKTPLSVIQGATSLLHITVEKSPSAMAFLTDIEKANQRLRRVIENMLDMTRLESGRFQTSPTGCDIRDVISAAERECADLLTDHPFEVVIPENIAEVRAEPVFLEHALSNLIANAAIHTPGGGKITVSVSSENRKVTVSVRDEGPGIPLHLQPKIFDKFFRGPDTKPGGTGLGLSTVKGLVESFGGTVGVVNNPGLGTTFSIVLPEASENER